MLFWCKGSGRHQTVTMGNYLSSTFRQPTFQAFELIVPAEKGEYKEKLKKRMDMSCNMKNLPFRRFRFPQQR
jgi:hypothetical protein